MFVEELKERIAVLEKTVDNHAKSLEKQQDRNDTQTELNTLLKLQIDTSKEQNKQMEKFGDTLENINVNLTNLNINQQQMKNDMSEIGNRVSDIERNQEEQKIDPNKLFKGILKYIFSAIGTIGIAYILYKLGINSIHK